MMTRILYVLLLLVPGFTAMAGEIETNARIDGASLYTPGSSLLVQYDKYTSLPFPVSNPPILVNGSVGMIEFGIDETKKIYHASNLTSIITLTYTTKNFLLTTSGPFTQTLLVNYYPTNEYKAQAFYNLTNVSYINISAYSIVTYKDYGTGGQALIANPNDLYLEATIKVDETPLFDFSTSLPASSVIGHNVITSSGTVIELQMYWDYIPGAEEYELEWIFVDDYDIASYGSAKGTSLINYDFLHDATRIVTSNQHYTIPMAYEKGWIIYRVRGIGRSQTNNNARLEGTWSNSGFETGTLNTFLASFPLQGYHILQAHESDKINFSVVRTFAENGRAGAGVTYQDGVMKTRESVARLNTEDKTLVQTTLYDWQGRPSISVLPAPVNEKFLSYKINMNRTSGGTQYDKTVFDNLTLLTNTCLAQGQPMDAANSLGAARYYSTSNTDKEGQQAMIPQSQGFPFVQIEYYPDQTGKIKRESMPGGTHFMGSGKEHKFYYAQPTQEELVRLFGTEVGNYGEYQKLIEVDPNGQTSVSYNDDDGKTIATGLYGANPSNLLALADATNPATSQSYTTTLFNNNNDPGNYVLELSNNFFASQGETHQLFYDVTVPQYTDNCLPGMCMDCIYELEISVTDDCGREMLDGDPSAIGMQPLSKILGRYTPTATPQFTTTCPGDPLLLNFSLSNPTPYAFNAMETGVYHISKKLKLSTLPLTQYAQEYVQNNTCLQTLTSFQEQALSSIDLTGCDLDCASCSTSVNNLVAGLPPGTLSSQQVSELLEKCNLKCDMQNMCASREKLLLMHFKPGAYFAKYNVSGTPNYNSTDPLSIYNPSNILKPTLGIVGGPAVPWYALPPASYGTYTVINPASGLAVTPDQLIIPDFVGSYNDNYANPWLKWHPEYCKLQFYCDGLVNALTSYSSTINNISSFDEACKQGFMYPFASATGLQNAPNASSCPCTPGTNQYIPLASFSGTSSFSAGQISSALTAFTSSFNATTYNSTAGSITANLYQYAISAGSNLNTNDIISGAISTRFGNDNCYRDRQWEFYKRFYLNLINNMMENLKSSYISGWNPSNGGCLSNFSSLPGYVKIFPDGSSAGMAIINNFGGGTSTSSGSVAAASTTVAAQCASFCHSYVTNWMSELAPCAIPDPSWPAVQSALEAVCTAGCDSQDPFGASNCVPGVTLAIGSSTVTVYTFQDVLSAYGYTPTAGCNAYLISTPKPKGYSYSGAATTTPTLDACGCNAILSAHSNYTLAVYNYTTGATSNTVDPCVTSEAEFVAAQLGNPLYNLSSYVCACQQAFTGSTYNFTVVPAHLLGTLALPENLACNHCIPCGQLQNAYRGLTRVIPGFTVTAPALAALDPVMLTNFLNSFLNMNNTYNEWIAFMEDCRNNTVQGSYNGLNGISSLTTPEASNFSTLFGVLAANNFLIPNTPASYYLLNTSNAAAFFGSSLWPSGLTTVPSASVLITTNVGSTSMTIAITSTAAPAYNCSFVLQVPPPGAFPDFSTVNSVSFSGVKGVCNKTSSNEKGYLVNFSYTDNVTGAVTTLTLTGTNSCYTTLETPQIPAPQNKMCQPYLCSNSMHLETPVNDCISTLINNALNTAQTQYDLYISQQVEEFLSDYKTHCYANVTEQFKRAYSINEYNYTLFYYDRSDNLVHTVPPASVQVITNPATIANAITYVNSVGTSGTAVYPSHSFNDPAGINSYVNHLQYNSQDELLVEVTPDGGETIYLYDNVGRIAASRNAKQEAMNRYSYTLYDNFGRITEVGAMQLTTALGDVLTADIVRNPTLWAAFVNGHFRGEVTQTFYDNSLNATTNAQFTGGQKNLRNRISAITHEISFDNDIHTYDYASFYSYDDHGNATKIVHHKPALNYAGNNSEFKHLEYEYELVSSNVTKISYQKGKPDQFYHRYFYDADNRLQETQTSNNGLVFQCDVKQYYYQHGPGARVELGEKQVQGMDFAYTIQGWIKGANSVILHENNDIGKDANESNAYISSFSGLHRNFAKDASSYNLNYYTGDYNPIKASSINFIADMTNLNASSAGVGFKLSADAPDLYNGNIASMVTSLYDINVLSPDRGLVKPQITAYRYDQLHRIKNAKAYSSLRINDPSGAQYSEAISLSANQWITPTNLNYVGLYQMSFDYDKIGNITKLTRDGDAVFSGSAWTVKKMDDLKYNYETAAAIYVPSLNQTINRNSRLKRVNDNVFIPSSNYNNDIENQVNANNYDYDETGSLKQDLSEEVQLVEWTEANKVRSVTRTPGSLKADVYFEYDPAGRRISKKVIGKTLAGLPDPNNIRTTHYVLDPKGQTIATYEEKSGSTNTLTCTGQVIFAVKRMGVHNVKIDMLATPSGSSYTDVYYGNKNYEMLNHLSNVITTVTDRKRAIDGKYTYTGNGTGNYVFDGYTFLVVAAGTGYYTQVAAPDGIVDYYMPDIRSTSDYYAFGQNMPGRTMGDYRYKHNSQEKDDEIFDGALTAEYWEYDARLGRRWEQDPLADLSMSPYACFANNPIAVTDLNGDLAFPPWKHKKKRGRGPGKVKGNYHPGKGKLGRALKGFFKGVGRGIAQGFVKGVKGLKQACRWIGRKIESIDWNKTLDHFRFRWGDGSGIRIGPWRIVARQHRRTTDRWFPWHIERVEPTHRRINWDDFGFSFGLRIGNTVFFDIQLGRVGRYENFFPGRFGMKNFLPFNFFVGGLYRVWPGDPSYHAPDSHMPLYTKAWRIACIAMDAVFPPGTPGPVNEWFFVDLVNKIKELFNGMGKRRYKWI